MIIVLLPRCSNVMMMMMMMRKELLWPSFRDKLNKVLIRDKPQNEYSFTSTSQSSIAFLDKHAGQRR